MRLAQTNYDNAETGCCARLDASEWDGKTFEWQDKPFLKDHIRALFHMPLNFGSVISRDHTLIEESEAYPEQPFWLTDEVSPWGSDIYITVDREIPSATIERMSGTFVTKLFEGPYRNAGKWAQQMHESARNEGRELDKIYFWYATCPKCAQRLGKNQVVLFAQSKA